MGHYVYTSAKFSTNCVYRYWLLRQMETHERRRMLFVGLNPSTADETTDDPTIRRVRGYAEREGCSSFWMCNLFAYRSTDPKVLGSVEDPIGPQNLQTIQRLASDSDIIVAGWGAGVRHVKETHGGWADVVLSALRHRGRQLVYCFGTTKCGQPRHPLYLPSREPLVEL